MAKYTQEEYKMAREVNVLHYLKDAGYELEKSGKDYQLKQHDSLKISPNGKWYWHSHSMGGESPIPLVKELESEDTIGAIKRLADYAKGNGAVAADIVSKTVTTTKEVKFELPEKNATVKRAYAYLVDSRGLDAEIINHCIDAGLIYESKKYHNAVFVGQKDDSGHVKHASLRGTYTTEERPFKGDVSGSDKAYSFALEGKNDILFVCESAIDALSHATMAKIAGADWQEDHRLALGGMSDSSLDLYLKRHSEIKNLVFCLDNDINGKDKDGNPENHGQVRAEKLASAYKEKGYTVLNQVTKEKDLNEELKVKRKENSLLSNPEVKKTDIEMDQLIKQLQEGVRAVYTSDRYINYLKFVAKFHHYSLANCILIAMQMPNATLIAGYQAWKKKFGRNVKKGEKGIRILAPFEYKKKEMVEMVNKETGEITSKEQEVIKKYFRPVSVFDVSQTDGKELPRLVSELQGSVEHYDVVINAIKEVSEFPIVFEEMEPMKGYFSPGEKKIAIKVGMSQVQNLKTIIHELAHSRLHIDSSGKLDMQSKNMREIQAESVAFVVSEKLGLDTSDYSFPYIASYGNRELEDLKDSLKIIQKESNAIIKELSEQLQKNIEIDKVITEDIAENHFFYLSKQDALEAFEKKIPIYDTEYNLINNVEVYKKGEMPIFIKISDLEKNQDKINGTYHAYVLSLFKEAFEKNPIEAMRIFGSPITDSSLNQVVLFKDPLIKKALNNADTVQSCIRTIIKQVDNANAVKAKVKVQILQSEAKLNQGEFYSLAAANKMFQQYESKVRGEKEEYEEKGEHRGYDKTKFALYIEDKGQWQYGISRYDIGDGHAINLIDFIRKSMYPDIVKKCEKELQAQNKKIEYSKEKTMKGEKEHV